MTLPAISHVAIIGAGVGGLAAAKAFYDEKTYNITVFERNSRVGGTWIYSPTTNTYKIPSNNVLEVDPPGNTNKQTHSAIYEDLHTNLPTPVMCFRGFPFPPDTPLFPHHDQVLSYIEQFSKSHHLESMIKFNTNVVKADYLQEKKVWQLSLSHEQGEESQHYVQEFDALVVANGHYSVPWIPDIQGLTSLVPHQLSTLKVYHSQDYRTPIPFRDQNVLVVGGGASAFDIVRQVSTTAKQVYHSIRTKNKLVARAIETQTSNCSHVPALKQFIPSFQPGDQSVIELEDGTLLKDIHVVVLATGYLYSFPFLSFEKSVFITDGQKVHGLYRHLFYRENPTLAFIGLPIKVAPFPLCQVQSIVVARCWNERAELPCKLHMEEEEAAKYGLESNSRNDMTFSQEEEFDYVDQLSAWAERQQSNDISTWTSDTTNTERLPQWWKDMRSAALDIRRDALGY